jgi:hypothetical protein
VVLISSLRFMIVGSGKHPGVEQSGQSPGS